MAWLIANERVRDYGCNSVRAAAEYFNKACAPGARSPYFQNRSAGSEVGKTVNHSVGQLDCLLLFCCIKTAS